jgi:hypothetical protein
MKLYYLQILGTILIVAALFIASQIAGIKAQTLPVPSDDANRVAFTGDVDCNTDQKNDISSMKQAEVQTIVIAGDYAYSKGSCVLGYLKDNGYSNGNTILAVGNHDKCSDVMQFTGEAQCWYQKTIGGVQYFVIDANQAFDSKSKQYTDIKKWIEASTAKYKVVVIHHPFVTAKSTHGNNGEFKLYNPIFKQNGIGLVDQAHNHNYQRFLIDDITYLTTGTGYHDEGSALYDIKSKDDGQGHTAAYTNDLVNGYTVVDFTGNSAKGYFVSSDNEVSDTFNIINMKIGNGTTTPPPAECLNGTLQGNECIPNPPVPPTIPPSNASENVVCACKNGTVIVPPAENQTIPPIDNGTIPIPPSNGSQIDTEENVVCACKNGTVTIPPPKPELKPAQNVTITPFNNLTDISNATQKIIIDTQKVAIIPLKNNTDIQVFGNITRIGWLTD